MKPKAVIGLLGVLVIGALTVLTLREARRYRGWIASPGALPAPLPAQEEAVVADAFDYPLDPARFGAYVPRQSGPPPVDTRFGAQNPALGNAGKCFVDKNGENVPFSQLHHAGEDWLALNQRGRITPGKAAGQPVFAVANGVVESSTLMGFDGYVIIVAHVLNDGEAVWSVY